jgi:hypothetical protein
MKKLSPTAAWYIVKKDNGCAKYANKEETRVEGPWSYGDAPGTQGGDHKSVKP